MKIKINIVIAFYLMFVSLSGCNSEGEFNLGNGKGGNFNNPGSGSPGNSTGDIGVKGSIGNLDCNSLSPDKVYFIGSLDERPSTYVITDPEDPTNFCGGFPVSGTVNGPVKSSPLLISKSGKLIYSAPINKDIYQMQKDDFTIENGEWSYPTNTTGNDSLITIIDEGVILGQAVASTDDTDNIFYINQVNSNIHDKSEVVFENSQNDKLLASLPDGSLLLGSINQGLIIISEGHEPIALIGPESGPFDSWDMPAKISSEGTVWVGVRLGNDPLTLKRWKIDLADNSIIDEGRYADVSSDTFSNLGGTIDGNGDLWNINRTVVGGGLAVTKTPIFSSGRASEVIYRIPDIDTPYNWKEEQTPLVGKGRSLITGP